MMLSGRIENLTIAVATLGFRSSFRHWVCRRDAPWTLRLTGAVREIPDGSGRVPSRAELTGRAG